MWRKIKVKLSCNAVCWLRLSFNTTVESHHSPVPKVHTPIYVYLISLNALYQYNLYISEYNFMYFKKGMTFERISEEFLSRIFRMSLWCGSKNLFLASVYSGQVVKMCLIVTWELQITQSGGSSPPGKCLFVSLVCPNRILLYFISSSLVVKEPKNFSPILPSTKCNLFRSKKSHWFWSQFFPFPTI